MLRLFAFYRRLAILGFIIERTGMIYVLAFCLFTAPICLTLGITMPLLKLEKLWLFEQTPSLTEVVTSLWTNQEGLLAIIIGAFSIAFPMIKLFGLYVLALTPKGTRSIKVQKWLSAISAWSMLDVMVVALVIFAAKTSGLAAAFSQIGLWFYVLATLLSAAASRLLKA